MKKQLFVVCCLFFVAVAPVWAESNQSYNQFVTEYRQYQNLLSPFNVAQSKYLTYKSVIAQGEYLDAARDLIASEIICLNRFTQFLIDYLNEANQAIGLSDNVVLVKLNDLQSRVVGLSNRQGLIDSLESARVVMNEVEGLYGEMYRLSYWTKATIESTGVKKIYDNLGIEKPKIAAFLDSLPVTYRENQAAIEKFKSLEKSYNLIAETIAGTYTSQIEFDNLKADPVEIERGIHKQFQKVCDSLYNLVLGYQNIIFAVRKN